MADHEVPMSLRILGLMDALQPAMRRVGQVITDDPARVVSMSITALADEASTSETTVIRFCKEVGVSGYAQLRLALAAELGAKQNASANIDLGDITPDDDIHSVIQKISFADIRSVEDTAKTLSISELAAVVAEVVQADRIDLYGVGASGLVAMDFQQKLQRIGLVANAYFDLHQAAVAAGLANSKTVAFGFSHSGKTKDTLSPLKIASDNGAVTVAITNAPKSPIAELADHTLVTAARETTFRAGATGSRLAQLTMVDFLFVAIAQHSYEESMHALEMTHAAVSEFSNR